MNFVHGLPAFGISMGLVDASGPAVAALVFPKLGETFLAVRGGGATLNGTPIRVSSTPDLGRAVIATGFPYQRDSLVNPNLDNFNRFVLRVRGIRRMGSAALDLAYVAAGRLDAYWELHLSPHDMAGGALLVLEAGGRVTDAQGGQDWLRAGHIVAAGPALHAVVLDDVQV